MSPKRRNLSALSLLTDGSQLVTEMDANGRLTVLMVLHGKGITDMLLTAVRCVDPRLCPWCCVATGLDRRFSGRSERKSSEKVVSEVVVSSPALGKAAFHFVGRGARYTCACDPNGFVRSFTSKHALSYLNKLAVAQPEQIRLKEDKVNSESEQISSEGVRGRGLY